MRLADIFDHDALETDLIEIQQEIESITEYNYVSLPPDYVDKVKQLHIDITAKLSDVKTLLDSMHKIQQDSFGY